MTFSITVPEPQPSPKDTQVQIQTNFSTFQSIFSGNHTAINNTNQGNHEAIILENQAVDPGVVDDLVALYCKNARSATSKEPQIFAQILKFLPTDLDTTNAANTPMQLTYNAVNNAGPVYQSFLIGGYLLYFGVTSNIAVPITLLPTPTVINLAIATATNSHGSSSIPNDVSTTITQPNQIKINSSTAVGGDTFWWIAIAAA